MAIFHHDQMVGFFNRALKDMREDEFCLSWHQHAKDITILKKDDFTTHIRRYAQYDVKCAETHIKEHNGKKYKIMCFQPIYNGDEDAFQKACEKYGVDIDPLVLMVFGLMISAWCYIIPQKD